MTAEFLEALPQDRREPVEALYNAIRASLRGGFEERVSGGMIHWVVPHSRYPAGYHCNPQDPLPFVSLASQKGHVALYHMGLYAMPDHLDWFQKEWAASGVGKLDMGKSCIRFKKPGKIPLDLITRLAQRISVDDWVRAYENAFKK